MGQPIPGGRDDLEDIREIFRQAQETGTIASIYFEGGEPFLYYPILVQAIRLATQQGFQVGVVSNSYWATSVEDALEWLRPLAGLVSDLSVSSDLYHYSQEQSQQAENARLAAEALGIPLGTLSVAQPEAINAVEAVGQLPQGGSAVMYRGRAAEKLASRAQGLPLGAVHRLPARGSARAGAGTPGSFREPAHLPGHLAGKSLPHTAQDDL